jgi:hypothetical protein
VGQGFSLLVEVRIVFVCVCVLEHGAGGAGAIGRWRDSVCCEVRGYSSGREARGTRSGYLGVLMACVCTGFDEEELELKEKEMFV